MKSYPNSWPKNPLDDVNFFSASAMSCTALASLSAILQNGTTKSQGLVFRKCYTELTNKISVLRIFS